MPKASAAHAALNTTSTTREIVPLGGIAWNEYAASDVGKAREFFAALLGWSARVKEFAFDGAYTTFTCDGRDVAGLLSLKDLKGAGTKPGWFPVIRTNSVDIATARAVELGASILSPPTGLPGLDRHSMLAGPSQGRYSLLELGESEILRAVGCVCWNELRVTNPAATALFFWQTFGWNAESLFDDRDGLVITFLQGGKRVASMRKAGAGEMSRCMPCIGVANVETTVLKATELGGALIDGRPDDPVLGTMARISDPLGSDFVVFSRH